MSSQVHHFSPDFLSLLVDTIPRLCRSKKDVLTFFSGAGVSQKVLANLIDRVHRDAAGISKYEIARTVLLKINEAGDAMIRERREVVKRVVEFEDFSRCWPNDQMEAKGLVADVRHLVNVKDSFTKMKQSYQSKVDEETKKRQLEQKTRLDQLAGKRQIRQAIRSDLLALYSESDTKNRGKQLEGILNRLFEIEEILVRESFTITGENSEGIIQQIDGAIEFNSKTYLVEMKWWNKKLAPKDVAQHMVRIFGRSDVCGIFISASGYTDAAIIDIKRVLNQKLIVLFTVKEIVLLLEEDRSFGSLLSSKIEAVQLDGKLVYD